MIVKMKKKKKLEMIEDSIRVLDLIMIKSDILKIRLIKFFLTFNPMMINQMSKIKNNT